MICINGDVKIQFGYLEKILSEGLRVLAPVEGIGEGQAFRILEMTDLQSTGRIFFARAMHVPEPEVVQFTLGSFMELANEEGKMERIPMAGEFENEKYTIPSDEKWSLWSQRVKGEKPLWLYRGAKWLMELSLSGLVFRAGAAVLFGKNLPSPPDAVYVKVQGQGGERIYSYRIEMEVTQVADQLA